MIRLHVKPESLTRTPLGTISGMIYFATQHGSFPSDGWTDLVVAFLLAWIDALMRVSKTAMCRRNISFMDGPYSIGLVSKGQDLIEVTLSSRETAGPPMTVDVRKLLQDAISNGRAVLHECRKNGWADDDVARLDASIAEAVRTVDGDQRNGDEGVGAQKPV